MFAPSHSVARYLCDGMLGRLARWLRLLGHDVLYCDSEDDELLALARGRPAQVEAGGPTATARSAGSARPSSTLARHLLTRDRELAARAGVAVIVADDLRAQLVEVAPPPAECFTRCTACNGPLRAATADEAAAAPPKVRAAHDDFRACATCGQLYWPGTHWERIRATLAEWGLLEAPPQETGPPEAEPPQAEPLPAPDER